MQKYADVDRDSGVDSFENGPTAIRIKFKGGGKVYVYTYNIPGQSHVEQMKQLALSGNGLNAYINKYVRKNYDHIA